MSALVAEAPRPRAVIVALHGGATHRGVLRLPRPSAVVTAARSAAALGFTVVALDRPGLRRIGAVPRRDRRPGAARRAGVRRGRQDPRRDAAWRRAVPARATPRAANWPCGWPSTTGAGDVSVSSWRAPDCGTADAAKAIIERGDRHVASGRAAGSAVAAHRPLSRRGADRQHCRRPGAAYEAEVTANWPRRDFPALAARVRVPVEFSVAEHESVWESDPEALAAIAALFTASPRVRRQRNGRQRTQSQRRPDRRGVSPKVLSFVEECVAARHADDRGTKWRRVDARRIHRAGQPGRPDGAADRRRRIRDHAVGTPAGQPRAVRRHRREDRRHAGRTRRGQRPGLPLRGRRRRRQRGARRREPACWPDWRRAASSPSTAPCTPTPAARSPKLAASTGRFGDRRTGQRRRPGRRGGHAAGDGRR